MALWLGGFSTSWYVESSTHSLTVVAQLQRNRDRQGADKWRLFLLTGWRRNPRLRNRHSRVPRRKRDSRIDRIRMRFEQRHGADSALRRSDAFQLQHTGLLPKIQAMHRLPGTRINQLRELQQLLRRNQLQLRFVLRVRSNRKREAENRGEDQSLHPEPLSRKVTSFWTRSRAAPGINPPFARRPDRQHGKRRADRLRQRASLDSYQR